MKNKIIKCTASSHCNNIIECDCYIEPKVITDYAINLKVKKVLVERVKINKLLVQFRDIGRNIKIEKIFIVNAIHPNANELIISEYYQYMYKYFDIYDKISELCLDTDSFEKNKLIIILEDIIHKIAIWNYQNSYWKDYSLLDYHIENDSSYYDFRKRKHVNGSKIKRRVVFRKCMDMIKNPIGKIMKVHPDDFADSITNICSDIGMI